MLLLLLTLGLFDLLVHAQSFYPAAFPLAVRSPYLNSYFNALAGSDLPNLWPQHWNLKKTLGWSGWIRVDGTTYQLWGQSGTPTNLSSIEVTPTRTTMNIIAGSMDVKVTFLSPIEPNNLVLQSLPFAYVYAEASSNDGKSHATQFYSDISCEWISGDQASLARWNTTQTSSTTFHQCARQSQETAQEIGDMVEDGIVYYAMTREKDDTSYQTGNDSIVRGNFRTNGGLFNSVDDHFRAINQNFVVLGHSIDLRDITSTSSPVVWAVGLVRDPAIIMTTESGNQSRHSYFFSEYGTVDNAIDLFVKDFDNAQQRATDLDNRVLSDAKEVSDEYADLVSLAARQALAADVTISQNRDGTYNTSEVMTFVRDLGVTRRSSPVEVIYAAFPAYLYFNASWAGALLRPILKYEASAQYSRSYAGPDLGSSYPYIDGFSDPNILRGIEDSGDMLIMGWAHARFSGDGSLLKEYYSTYKSYADYIISSDVVTPNGYADADGLDYANITNLALKGIIGIKAMSEISSSIGNADDVKLYSDQANTLNQQWQSLADNQGHLVATYNEPSSWALIYNVFADKLLGTNMVSDSIISQQDAFYAKQVDVAGSFGLPYDISVPDEVKSHWTLFTAAATKGDYVRDALISMVHTKASSNETAGVFPTTYNANNGSTVGGQASPAQGAMFSLLSLRLEAKTVNTPVGGSSGRSNTGAIAGGVVGGVIGIALIGIAIFFWRRRQQNRYESGAQESGWFGRKERPDHPEVLDDTYLAQPFNSYTNNGGGREPFNVGPTTATEGLDSPPLPMQYGVLPTPAPLVPVVPANYPRPRSGKGGYGIQPDSRLRLNSQLMYDSSSTGDSGDRSTHLRSEVENLRRELEEVRARNGYEPPPRYNYF